MICGLRRCYGWAKTFRSALSGLFLIIMHSVSKTIVGHCSAVKEGQ